MSFFDDLPTKELPCLNCGSPQIVSLDTEIIRCIKCINKKADDRKKDKEKEVAKRDFCGYRYDILVASFIQGLARIAWFGARKYGDFNWTKSRSVGENSPVNHIYAHLQDYQNYKEYDHLELGSHPKNHLLAIAFNAMMEYWYQEHPKVK